MRHATGLALGLMLLGATSTAQAMVGAPGSARIAAPASDAAVTKVEYFCSPGFEPSYGGTCLAVAPRAEVELFVDQPIFEPAARVYRSRVRRHRHHGLSERY